MKMISLEEELKGNAYPGRGIVIGKSQDGKKAVTAYFIMGRSVNSRNRVFTETEDGIRTEAADPSKLTDPHLIIYAPVRVLGNKTIVTNGDQTDTIYELMDKQQTFEQSLRTREYEDDAPNYTPRISGIMHVERAKAEGHKVIMIGDGINDSPALSAADIGIAISDGAEIAREIADITVGADNLNELITLRKISTALTRRIRRNYRTIVGFNTGLIVLGVAGVIQPTTSALMHNTSTLAIGLHSMKDLVL